VIRDYPNSNASSTGCKPVSQGQPPNALRKAIKALLPLLLIVHLGGSIASPQVSVDSTFSDRTSRFAWVDAWIDPHGQPLGAYQFELKTSGADVALVGVEGGDHSAFTQPPYYDPKANLQRRIVIAAYNTSTDLPHQRTRVARIMVRITGAANPKYSAALDVAASSEAKPIDASVSVEEGAAQ
jgi:hypothetical protein